MRLNESGKKVGAMTVDDDVPPAVRLWSDRNDAAVADTDRPIDDVEAVVHRDDRRVTTAIADDT